MADPPPAGARERCPGVYAVTPVGRYVSGGYYEPGSLIWRSRWITEADEV